jgi:hypothetical protein
LKEQLSQTLTAFVTSVLVGPRRLAAENAAEPPLRQIIDVLLQVMCPHDAEKLAISVLEIYEDRHREEQVLCVLSTPCSSCLVLARAEN